MATRQRDWYEYNQRVRLLLLLTTPAFLIGSVPVAAQSAASVMVPSGAVKPEGADIIVTATRRNTGLEETPVAVSAFTSATIEEKRLFTLSDVALEVPGLVFTPFSRQESYVSIRGTTVNNDAPGSDLGVSVFVDDVPTIGVVDNNVDLFDLKGIEVLRGPQGTLFGRNVTGGAVVVNTLEPSFTPGFRGQLTYGNDNLLEARGYVTGPIVADKLAGKFTFSERRQDGLLNNIYAGGKTLNTQIYSLRGQLLWTPSEDFRVKIGADFSHDTSQYKAAQLIGNFQPSLFPPLSYNPDDTDQGSRPSGDAKVGGALLRADWTHDWGTLTSISGYRQVQSREIFATSGDPFNEILQNNIGKGRQFTEELRLASPERRRFTYVAGLFFLTSKREDYKHYDLNVLPGTLASLVDPYSAAVFSSDQNQVVNSQSYAAFGEATYALTDQLKLTVGARYTYEHKSGNSQVTDTSGLSPVLINPYYSKGWSAFTPKATVTYEPRKGILAYATVATGFKSGGFDLSGATVQALGTPFQPEKVTSYEGGFKITGFDNRLTVNIAGYLADYRNLQVIQFNPAILTFATSNAGSARIPGVELEVSARPTNWISLTGAFTYMDAHYTHYDNGASGADFVDFSGNQIPFDAKYHTDIGFELHAPIAFLGNGEGRFGGDVAFQSSRFFNDDNSDPTFIRSRTPIKGQLNLHADWTSPNESWEVQLWGKNITNTRYLVYGTDLTAFFATPGEFFTPGNKIYDNNWNQKRTFGISVTFKR